LQHLLVTKWMSKYASAVCCQEMGQWAIDERQDMEPCSGLSEESPESHWIKHRTAELAPLGASLLSMIRAIESTGPVAAARVAQCAYMHSKHTYEVSRCCWHNAGNKASCCAPAKSYPDVETVISCLQLLSQEPWPCSRLHLGSVYWLHHHWQALCHAAQESHIDPKLHGLPQPKC